MWRKIYCEHAKVPFLSVGYCSHSVFSMALQGSFSGFVRLKGLFSWHFARLAISLCGDLGCLDAVFARVNVGFLLHGMVGYGSV